ncbi:hypothetical protein QTO15_27675 [Vibrio owensii]|uniref:hypothetical protein n=1 Tax=Vibrio owensii TaxID=696485 RepID=UPI002F422646
MTRTTSAVLILILMSAYFAYNADITSTSGKRAYSEGYITYSDRSRNVCKQVVFNFKINSLRSYSISDLHDCSLGEYY